MRWKRTVCIGIAVLLALAAFPILSAFWSRQQLEYHRGEIRRIDDGDPTADPRDLERRTGIHFTAHLLNEKPDHLDICASIKPMFYPFGLWTIDHDGKIAWMTRADLDEYRAKRKAR